MAEAVILVAGGTGKRFGSSIPKQFLLLNELPVYIHTISKFLQYNATMQVILVLPMHSSDDELRENQKQLSEYFNRPIHNCRGGVTRFDSVKNGLACVESQVELIAVHDAVRPLVRTELIQECFSTASEYGNAVPVVDMVYSVRKINGEENKAVDRSQYKIVQTPQCFQNTQLVEAYQQANHSSFTDDASVVEHAGYNIKMVKGNPENIKITTPPDLLYAEYLIQQQT